MSGNKEERYLSGISIWALSFGCIIGWGSFVMPGTNFLPEAGPLGAVIGIVISAVLMLIVCYNYGFLSGVFPGASGSVYYTRNVLGPDHSFLAAWALELAYISLFWANTTAFIVIGRSLFGDVLEWGFHYTVAGYDIYLGEVLATLVIMWVFGLITCCGKKLANILRTVFAVILFAAVVILFIMILAAGGGENMLTPSFSGTGGKPVQVLNIVILAPWMFVGFETVAHSVSESKLSGKGVFRAAAAAVTAGMLVYIFLTLTASSGFPEGYASKSEYLSDLGNLSGLEPIPVLYNSSRLLGTGGLVLVAAAAFCALATSALGFHRASARMIRIMADGEILPSYFRKVNSDGIPVRASLLVLIISTPIPFIGRTAVGWNADVSTLTGAIVYAYISVCAFICGHRAKNRKAMAAGVIGIIAMAVILFFLLVPNIFSENVLVKETYLILALWALIGIIYYRYVFKKDSSHSFGRSTVMWLMMLFILFFSVNVWARLELQTALSEGGVRAENAVMMSSLLQLAVIAAALLLVFSLVKIMVRRETELNMRVVEAQARDRAKSDFLFNMSHDIRTPMNAIIGFTDLALEDSGDREKTEEYLGKIKVSGEHLLSLINDILEMSRIESGKMELSPGPVNIPEVMETLKTIMQGQALEKKQDFRIDYSNITDKDIVSDRLRLDQILLNLASNAVKYTPEGGSITVSVFQEAPAGNEGDALYEFRVKDNGTGMAPEFAEKVFEAFERERTSTVSGIQGTGLGLAITKKIVDNMGGEISVITAPGQGSEFIVRLAAKVCASGEIPVSGEKLPDDQFSFEGKRVLIVDDVQLNRQILKLMLELSGFQVMEAQDGKEAVGMVSEAQAGFFDAVLMDIQMPGMNGYDATRAIRALSDERKRSIPVIAVTANAFTEDKKNAAEAGMNGHIAKPVDREVLLEVLRQLLFV